MSLAPELVSAIKKDLVASARFRRAGFLLFMLSLAFALGLCAALGFRPDLKQFWIKQEIFNYALTLLFILVSIFALCRVRSKSVVGHIITLNGALLAFSFASYFFIRTSHPNALMSWSDIPVHEDWACLASAIFIDSIIGTLFLTFQIKLKTALTTSLQRFLAATIAVSGLVFQSWHCPVSSLAHLAIIHFGAASSVTFLILLLEKRLSHRWQTRVLKNLRTSNQAK